MKARNLASVGLSLALAANCFMPCYTLAYADDLGEGSEIEFVDDLSSDIEPGADDSDFGGIEEAENSGSAADGADFGVAEANQSEALSNESIASDGDIESGESITPALELPVGFDASDISTYPYWCTDSDSNSFIGADINYIVETIDNLTSAVESGTASGDDMKTYFQAVYAYLYIIEQEGLDSETYGWGTVSTVVNLLNTILGWAAPQTSEYAKLSTVLSALVYGYSGGKDKITFPWDTRLSGTGIAGLLALQWGYGFGGTVVIQKGSPFDLLGKIQRNSDLLSGVPTVLTNLRNLVQQQWGYGYGGTIVIEKGSPMDLLGKVQRNSDYVTSLYGLIQKQWGYGFGGTVVTEKGSPFDLLGKIQRNSDYITSLDSRASIANDLLGKIQRNSDFITSLDSRVSIVNDLLGKIQRNSDFITSLDSRLERYYPAHSQLVSKGFSDVLDGLGSLSVSVEVDLSGVESRLDSIIRLLTFAGVVENAKDVLDAIFGDMTLDATQAASAAVGSAIQNAFPFCIPAVLKQILGLLQADPAPPEFHFDFWGAPLDFGFGDWGGLADMTGWLSRIGFAVMLFANSRRFVFAGGVGGD